MRFPINSDALLVYPTGAEVTPVTVWQDGQDTGQVAVDAQGRATYKLAAGVVLVVDGKADTEVSVRVHAEPDGLVPMRPYRLTGEVWLSVWRGKVYVTADALEEVE